MMQLVMAFALAFFAAPHTLQDAIGARVWAKPDHFWWRRTVPGGHLWLTVDAKHGAKAPLFDHQRLATELNQRGGYAFTALTLPFADPDARFTVRYDGSNDYILEGAMVVEFTIDGTNWRCDLQIEWDWTKKPPTDYECKESETAPGAELAAANSRLSPDGRFEALVVEDNVAVRPAGGTVKMLTTDGTPGDAYDPGSLRWSSDSRRLSAYRLNAGIWQSDTVRANVRPLITYRELSPGR